MRPELDDEGAESFKPLGRRPVLARLHAHQLTLQTYHRRLDVDQLHLLDGGRFGVVWSGLEWFMVVWGGLGFRWKCLVEGIKMCKMDWKVLNGWIARRGWIVGWMGVLMSWLRVTSTTLIAYHF